MSTTSDLKSIIDASSREAEETVEAIHHGAVDAVVVQGPDGPQIIMLQGADEPYRVLVERMSDGALTLATDGTILFANRRISELTGHAPESLVGLDFTSLMDGAVPLPLDASSEASLLRKDGSALPVSVWAREISIGGATAKLVTITDLSIHRQAAAIAHAERFARSILEQATDAVVVLGLDGRITHASWMAEELAGQPPVGRTFSEAFSLETQSEAQAGTLARFSAEILDELLVTKPFHGVEVKLSGTKLANRSFLLSAGPLLNDAKDSIGSLLTMTEITERKRAEEQQTMLVAELNHRVKNILAIVQSVAAQTVRSTPSLESFSAAFSGRIKALSIAHDILTQTRWIGIGLNELLAEVLAPYRLAGEDRLSIEGPPVLLPAGAVLPLSMAVHELATNASKYGALSGPQGKVAIRWRLQCEGRPEVELNWNEEGGPTVERPPGSGFGTTLIERTIAYDLDGKAELAFPPEGLRCLLKFPAPGETEVGTKRSVG